MHVDELRGLFNERNSKTLRFFNEHPDILEVCDTLYFIGSAMPQVEAAGHAEVESSAWANLLWQQAASYLNESFFLLAQESLDSGLALIRMSTELARDVAVLRASPSKEELWRKRESKREKYRKTFRFNNKEPLGSAAQSLYKFCSQAGVHGHTTGFTHFEQKPELEVNGVTYFGVSKVGVIEAIGIWMRAFAPVHGLCAASNSGSGPEIYTSRDSYDNFKEAAVTLGPVLDSLESWVALARNEVRS